VDKYRHIVSYVLNTPWAITSGKLLVIMDLLAFYSAGHKFSAEEVQERLVAVTRSTARVTGGVQVLPLYGVIAQRMDLMTETSGGTSTEAFGAQFRAALADPQVGAIVIDVDSPGGTVSGVQELSEEIYHARGQGKPIVAVANSLMASAAYWIASAADEVVVAPSSEIGSIGVLAAHEDASAYYEQLGVKTTLISAGKYKSEGNPYEPLTEEARAHLQERVDEYYEAFVQDVARNRSTAKRPVRADDVRGGYGEGRVVGAKQAIKLGMADRMGTLQSTVERIQHNRARMRAELDQRARRLRAAAR